MQSTYEYDREIRYRYPNGCFGVQSIYEYDRGELLDIEQFLVCPIYDKLLYMALSGRHILKRVLHFLRK